MGSEMCIRDSHTTAYVRSLLSTIDWYRDKSVQYYWGTFRRLATGHKVSNSKVRAKCHKYYLGDRNERCSSRSKAAVLITAFTFVFFINGKFQILLGMNTLSLHEGVKNSRKSIMLKTINKSILRSRSKKDSLL